MQIQNIPAYVLTFAATFAPKGVAMEDVNAKLVSVVKSELGKHEVKTSKQGFARVSKSLEIAWSDSVVAKLTDDADRLPVKFYRFCEHARKTQLDFGTECEIALPRELKAWLEKVVTAMNAPKVPVSKELVAA